MICERRIVARVVRSEAEWTQIVLKQTPVLNPSTILAFWTIYSDVNWCFGGDVLHLYVDANQMERLNFPRGSLGCKILHEVVESTACHFQNKQRQEAHKEALLAELSKAEKLGILKPYLLCDIKHSLTKGLYRDMVEKIIAYIHVKRLPS